MSKEHITTTIMSITIFIIIIRFLIEGYSADKLSILLLAIWAIILAIQRNKLDVSTRKQE